MKNYSSVKYKLFQNIENESSLAYFFNKILDELNTVRIVTAPRSFKDAKELEENPYRFYQTCLFEMYVHEAVAKLEYWKKTICEYFDEYDGSWEFYARSKRLYSIENDGGGDDDYNDDGTIKTDVGFDNLESYSLLVDLINEDRQDIVIETQPKDLEYILLCLRVNAEFDIRDVFKGIDNSKLKSFRPEKGELIENSETDEILNKITSQCKGEDLSVLLVCVVAIISSVVDEIKELQKNCDNKKFFKTLLVRLDNILKFELEDEINRIRKKLDGI